MSSTPYQYVEAKKTNTPPVIPNLIQWFGIGLETIQDRYDPILLTIVVAWFWGYIFLVY